MLASLVYNNFPFLSHLNNKLKFIKNLNDKIRNDMIFRPYVHNLGWNTIDRLKEVKFRGKVLIPLPNPKIISII